MLKPRLSAGFFIQDTFIAAWAIVANLRPSFIAIVPLIPLHHHFVLILSWSAASFMLHSRFDVFHHALLQFGALWHLCGCLVQSWFKLKSVPVDLHLFCVLLFVFNSAIFALLCHLFSTAVGLHSKLEVGEGVGAQAGPCARGAHLPFGAHAAALPAGC
jgi:hypothetical protein